jgi:transposase
MTMHRIREVLRLKHECGLSHETIARALGIAKGSVANYVAAAQAAGVSAALARELDDAALLERLHPQRYVRRGYAVPQFAHVHWELRRKGVTLQLLWEEYREGCGPGMLAYSRTRFCELYGAFAATLRRSMRQEHKAGEKLFVDYAGQTVRVIDAATGEIWGASVFVAVWGASNYTFACATATQQQADWIAAHVAAFEYFGGSPVLLVPDNARALITKPDRYEPETHRAYEAMAEHYGCAVLPARPRKPRDKASVEAGVLLVSRWILARLRDRRFFSLAEVNAAIAPLLDILNDKPFQKLQGSRRSWFDLLERPVIRALPEAAYEYAQFKRAKVSRIDYHIEFGRHFYSVPHALVGQKVDLRVTASCVEVLFRNRRVASHARSNVAGGYTTVADHMPASHRAHREWTPRRLIDWAASIGGATRSVVVHILESKPHPEQGYRACLGMLNLAKTYSPVRLEAASARAVLIRSFSAKSVRSILQSGLDQQPVQQTLYAETPMPEHGNVRGPDYYH